MAYEGSRNRDRDHDRGRERGRDRDRDRNSDTGGDRSGGSGARRAGYLMRGVNDRFFVDFKAVEDLRRCMTPNGKIYSRKRLGTTAREQRMLSQALKRARYMALLPYTSATL